MTMAPIARIVLRYGVGFFVGSSIGQGLSEDGDMVLAVSLALGAAIEGAYLLARRLGWST